MQTCGCERNEWGIAVQCADHQRYMSKRLHAFERLEAEEREACAKVADDVAAHLSSRDDDPALAAGLTAEAIARAIRARNNSK